MMRKVKFQEGGTVQEPMTAAERRRQNIQRLNQRRTTNREQATSRAEVERFNERLRTGTLTPDDMRRMGGQSDVERFNQRLREGNLTAEEMRRVGGTPTPQASGGGSGSGGGGGGRGGAMVPSGGDRLPAVRPSSGELMRQGAGMGGGAPRTGPRVVGGAPGIAAAGIALGLTGEALRRYIESRRDRPITGQFEQGMEPEGSNEAADAERDRQASQRAPAPAPAPAPASRPPSRPPARPRSTSRQGMEPEGTQAAAEAERERQRAMTPAEERSFLERLFRRTNETGMDPATIEQRRNYLGSGAADTNVSYNKKGGLLKAKAPVKKPAMKKGGPVKAPAKKMKTGGKVPAPKKMMKGGKVAAKPASRAFVKEMERMYPGGATISPTKKPKKMMGGGRAMYAKGGMARGCK